MNHAEFAILLLLFLIVTGITCDMLIGPHIFLEITFLFILDIIWKFSRRSCLGGYNCRKEKEPCRRDRSVCKSEGRTHPQQKAEGRP